MRFPSESGTAVCSRSARITSSAFSKALVVRVSDCCEWPAWADSCCWRRLFMVSAGLSEGGGEGFAGAMEFSPDGVGGLVGDLRDGVVAQFLISDEQEQNAVFLG